MALHEFNKEPSAKDLKWFGLLLAVFFAVMGGMIAWKSDGARVFYIMGGVGVALGAVYYALPMARRPMYLGWMYLFFPVGFVVSLVLMGLVYFAVLTPIALILKVVGVDPMNRKFEKGAGTYWSARPATPPSERYFRQY